MQNITKSCIVTLEFRTDQKTGTAYYEVTVRDRDAVKLTRFNQDCGGIRVFIESLPQRCKVCLIDYLESRRDWFMWLAKSRNFRYIHLYGLDTRSLQEATHEFFSVSCIREEHFFGTLARVRSLKNVTKRVIFPDGMDKMDLLVVLLDLKSEEPRGTLKIDRLTERNSDTLTPDFMVSKIHENLGNFAFRELIIGKHPTLDLVEFLKITKKCVDIPEKLTVVWTGFPESEPLRCYCKGGLLVFASSEIQYKRWKRITKVRVTLFRRSNVCFDKLCSDIRCLLDELLFKPLNPL